MNLRVFYLTRRGLSDGYGQRPATHNQTASTQRQKERGFYSNVKSSFLFVTPLGFKPRTFRTGI